MKRIYLLRHAKSSWDDPALADVDRPLAPRGRRAAKAMAEHLRQEDISPELVLCSSSERTRDTLARLEFGEDTDVRIEPAVYAASATSLLEMLRKVPESVRSVMVIGHNPGIQDLAVNIGRGGGESARASRKFPTAALATLLLDGSWWELAPGSAEFVAFVKPKDLA